MKAVKDLASYGEGSGEEDLMADWIVADPEILGGKPCVRGTRISVEAILEFLASGATRDDLLATYPQITGEGLSAALEYAARSLRDEVVWDIKLRA